MVKWHTADVSGREREENYKELWVRNLCFLILVIILPFVKARTPAARSCKSTCRPAWEDMVTQGCKWEINRVKMNSYICYSCSYFFRVFFTLHFHATSSLPCITMAELCGWHASQIFPWNLSGYFLAYFFPPCPTSWCSFKLPSWFCFCISSYCPQHPLLFRQATLTTIFVSSKQTIVSVL